METYKNDPEYKELLCLHMAKIGENPGHLTDAFRESTKSDIP